MIRGMGGETALHLFSNLQCVIFLVCNFLIELSLIKQNVVNL
jgi:hypothetical protein